MGFKVKGESKREPDPNQGKASLGAGCWSTPADRRPCGGFLSYKGLHGPYPTVWSNVYFNGMLLCVKVYLRGITQIDNDSATEKSGESPVKFLTPAAGGLSSMLPTSRQAADCHSSLLASLARTLRSSSVVVSPLISMPLAICFRRRRMILPERVLGSASAKRTSSGLATGPISLPTWLRNSFLSSGVAGCPVLRVTKHTSAWPLSSSGRPTTAASATLG